MTQPSYTTTLGVNIDHVATLREARGTPYPDFKQAIEQAEAGGADGITIHLREDRRHVQDEDVYLARACVTTHLNLEMAATDEMLDIALRVKPDYCCLVPEKRAELTTEGGLDVIAHEKRVTEVCSALRAQDIAVSLFVEAKPQVLELSAKIGADIVELHTGEYALASGSTQQEIYQDIIKASEQAAALGLQVNAGHGLNRSNVGAIAAIPSLRELNIGHAIVADAVFVGLKASVQAFRIAMQKGEMMR